MVTAEAVFRVLRWAAGDAGLVVILEDLHWADDATLAVARYLVDHASEVPALVFGTIRTGEGREDARALLEAGGAQVCQIGRLTQDEARDMARACAGAGPWLDDAIAAVVRDAEGLPLLVEDLLATGDLGGVAPRFADTVRARLARLDDRQRAVAASPVWPAACAESTMGTSYPCAPALFGRRSGQRIHQPDEGGVMAIAAVFEFPGEPVEKYHRVFGAGEAIINQPNRLYHLCYRTDIGFTVIDVWADEQPFAAFGETLGPALHHAGLDAKPAVYPVEQVMTQDGTRSS